MPTSHVLKRSFGVCAFGLLSLSQVQAAESLSPGFSNLSNGLLAQLLYLPAGLLLSAVLVEIVARSKSSGSLHRGVFVILIGAVACSLAALAVAIISPATSSGLSGSPFAAVKIGAAFTGITLLACIAKWLCFRAHRSHKGAKPKSKKRGRGRGRRRNSSGDLRMIADLGYGTCLAGAITALVAAPLFAEPTVLDLPELVSEPRTQAEEDPPATDPLPTPTSAVQAPVVTVVPNDIKVELGTDQPELASPVEPEMAVSVETVQEPAELDMFPDAPGESMAESATLTEEPQTEPVSIASTPKPAARPVSTQRGGLAGADTYKKLIQPMLRSRCYSCHDEEKQKGDLRLDTPEWIRKGGKSGPVIIAGAPDKSSLFELISLDPSDDDIMPPKGKPLSAAQISWVGGWIREGAALGDGVAWPIPEGGIQTGLAIDGMTSGVTSTDESAVQVLLDSGVIVRPLSTDGKLLEVDFSHADRAAGAMQLEQLTPIAANIHTLDLKRTKITDADLKILSGMSNLRILQLQRTKITDAALPHLSGLEQLESLNLYSTKVSDAGLPELQKLTSLKKVYLWSTQVTPAGARELASVLGTDVVNMGE